MKKKDKIALLRGAVQAFIDSEIAQEASGDNGHYNVEALPVVIQGRIALAATEETKEPS